MKMYSYLRHLIVYFEQVLHPANAWSSSPANNGKSKRRIKNGSAQMLSPDGYNLRGGISKKQDKLRRNPAP